MKNTKNIFFIVLTIGTSFISHTYDRQAFVEEVKNIQDFTRTLSPENPLRDLIGKKLGSDFTSNETIANIHRIVSNHMLTREEKDMILSNAFKQESINQQHCLIGFGIGFFVLPLAAILLSAIIKSIWGS